MNILRCHIHTKVVEISVALVGLLLGTSFTHAQENSTRPETSRLRLKVVTTLPQPVIGRNTPDGGCYALLRGHDVIFVLSPATLRVIESRFVQAAK